MTTHRHSSVLRSGEVRLEQRPIFVAESDGVHRAEVILTRRGHLITSIEVNCPCGKSTILDCAYDDELKDSAGGAPERLRSPLQQ